MGGAGLAKANIGLGLSTGWGFPIAPPAGGGGWPGGLAPAGGGGGRCDVLCEVNGNTAGFFAGVSPTVAPGISATCVGPPLGGGGGAATWVGVRHRTTLAQRNAQKGYYGTGLAVQRYYSIRPGAWRWPLSNAARWPAGCLVRAPAAQADSRRWPCQEALATRPTIARFASKSTTEAETPAERRAWTGMDRHGPAWTGMDRRRTGRSGRCLAAVPGHVGGMYLDGALVTTAAPIR